MHKNEKGKKIDLITLENLIEKIDDSESLILKMDCEGCEYESVLKCPDQILKRFKQIFLEYHYGYKDLQKKLESCGFKVEITEPVYHKNPYAENKKMFVGDIRASKIS